MKVVEVLRTLSGLQLFSVNQARFVFYAQHTIERDMLKKNITFEKAFEDIKRSKIGQKYLQHVSLREMREEEKSPGTFMDKNTSLGPYLFNEYGKYVEDFLEILS